jgi:GH43 family beta-xylosidase
MENFELKGLHVDLCVCNQNKICPEHNGLKVSEIPKKILELEKENEVLKSKANSYDEIFANPCKNPNRFTDNVVLVNVDDLTEDFKNGNY